jgi:3-oxoacyl-[acyl-carrier protein] reductase
MTPLEPTCPRRLEGRKALVTGGGRGIGRAIAIRLAAQGASVAMCGRDERVLAETFDAIKSAGGCATWRSVDVSDEAAIDAYIHDTQTEFGGLDILVNNAALTAMSKIGFAPVVEMSTEEWARTLAINLSGAFYASRAAGKIMQAAGFGAIVNISSVHAHVPHATTPHYDVAKAGIESMTKNMALHLGRFGVRVNAIAPGPIDVWSGAKSRDPFTAEERAAQQTSTALRRAGSPEEVAAVAAFLASDEASYITGATIPVDGGFLLRHPGMSDGSDE